MLPIEKYARRLVSLAQSFPFGATSDELRAEAALPGPAFYEALRFAKAQHWLMLRMDDDRLVYSVGPQAVPFEDLPDEDLSDRSSGGNANGVAVSNLAQIMNDNTANMRQRIRAAATILGYKVRDDGVTEIAKRFLESVCANVDVSTDHRLEAGEILRRSEDVKIVPATERPPARIDDAPLEPPEPLASVIARRRARADRMELEAIERLRHIPEERPQLLALLASRQRNGNGGDDHGD
jgi:hypothetical protein